MMGCVLAVVIGDDDVCVNDGLVERHGLVAGERESVTRAI
jgi:hypothetical protein